MVFLDFSLPNWDLCDESVCGVAACVCVCVCVRVCVRA